MRNGVPLLAAAVTALTLTATTQAAPSTNAPPATVIAAALCIHDGYHYATHWQPGTHLTYTLYGHGFWRTTKTWSNGEAAWNADTGNGYTTGLQFTLYTWQSVFTPAERSLYIYAHPASATPEQVIYRAWLVYQRDGNSWREWGSTKTACGLS